MYIPTTSNQNRETACYDNINSDKYLSDLDSYNNNDSNCRSDDYNNYKSNYKSNSEKAFCTLTSIIEILLVQLLNVKKQKANMIYTLR